eukprot:CAMPEP_0183712784 /NCGR_PEP_ID=MMETSP0737-20130205/7849_1 /TAXON_ID=385413 /ORGANISM="Thalassiosira miniscula, Strain CCMP1093" /LENGTH=163 /DNA_ID=CAMNT_0025941481 /DNA_START=129 /DNA_END=620 /DNA_ORIENTATION=-
MMKSNILFAAFAVLCTLHGATSFSLNKLNSGRTRQLIPTKTILQSPQQPSLNEAKLSSSSLSPVATEDGTKNNNGLLESLFAGCVTFMATTPLSAFAAADDLELAELPPVYVPILFAIGVLGGVGVLTASLGNVMDEEASLGLQSGARAKKERERSRSSYFKK